MARGNRTGTPVNEERVLAGLAKGPLHPVYLFHGGETFFIERCLDGIRRRVLPSDGAAEVLATVFYGSEGRVDEILTLARTPAFFQDQQLIVVREAEKFKEADGKKLAAYVKEPNPETCLVFVAGEKLPAKSSLFKALAGLGADACVGFEPLSRARLKKWIERLAREKGVAGQLTPELLAGFLDEGTVPLTTIDHRLEMLSLYLGGDADPPGGDALPAAWCGGVLEKSFQLTDALMQGRTEEGLVLLHRFLEQGTPPMLLLSRMGWEVRKIGALQAARRCGLPPEGALQAARIPPFKKNQYLALAARVPERVVDEMFFALMETDRALKSGRANAQWPLEDLFFRIARRMPAG